MAKLDINSAENIELRKTIFATLLEAQDAGKSVPQSRAEVMDKFEVTDTVLKGIEREGMDFEWPPLG